MADDDNVVPIWADLMNPRPKKLAQPIVTPAGPGINPYARAALDREAENVAQAPKGRRNGTLNIAAFNLGTLIPGGYLTRDTIESALRGSAHQCGLEAGETEATLASGITAGLREPRLIEESTAAPPNVTEVDASDILPAGADGGEGPEEIASWEYQLATEMADQEAETPEPAYLVRTDGRALLYAGKVNGLIGESESGKSWVALLAATQALAVGETVVILDFEDSLSSVLGRIRSMLRDQPELLKTLHYARPADSFTMFQRDRLWARVAATPPDLVIVDGVNAAMVLMGLDINSNTDATKFAQLILRPMAATGACVCTVDHVPKSIEARGKGGIGAQAKRAMIDGCSLRVEIIEPFGVGQSGELRITVDKDRPGKVRGIAIGGTIAGRAHLVSIADTVDLSITASEDGTGADRWRPTHIMDEVSKAVEANAEPISQREIQRLVARAPADVRTAIAELIEAGYLALEVGGRRAKMITSLRPYREGDSLEKPVGLSGFDRVPNPVQTSGFVSPLPLGGKPTRDTPPDPVQDANGQTQSIDPDYSNCNGCGQLSPNWWIEKNKGYCSTCGAR